MKDSINLFIEILTSRQVVFHHIKFTESKLKIIDAKTKF